MVKIGQDYITSASVKSLQSCPTLQDPMDSSPPGSSVHGDSPGKNTGVGCCALPQGIFLIQGLNPGFLMSLALTGGFFTTSATWEAQKAPGKQEKISGGQGWDGGGMNKWDKWAMWLPPRLRHQDHTAITLWAHSPLCSSTCSSPLAQAGARKPLSRPTPEGESSDQVSPAPWSQVL